MQAISARYWQLKQENAQLNKDNSRERSSKQRWRAAFFLLLAATAYLCCFGCNLVRVQQEADWQLRVALVQSYADYQQATGVKGDPATWMDAFPPTRYQGLSRRQQILLDQSLQALRRSHQQAADLSAAAWQKACVLAQHTWEVVCTCMSATAQAAAAAALTAHSKAVTALQPYGLFPKQQQQQGPSMHSLAFSAFAWSPSRAQLWQQVSVEQPLGAAQQQSQQQWHQGVAAAAAASGSSPAATLEVLTHIDITMAHLLADVTQQLVSPTHPTRHTPAAALAPNAPAQAAALAPNAPAPAHTLPAGPQCQSPSLSDLPRCSGLPSAPAAVDCVYAPLAMSASQTADMVAYKPLTPAPSSDSIQHHAAPSAPAPAPPAPGANKRGTAERRLPFLADHLAASARLLACAQSRLQAGMFS